MMSLVGVLMMRIWLVWIFDVLGARWRRKILVRNLSQDCVKDRLGWKGVWVVGDIPHTKISIP